MLPAWPRAALKHSSTLRQPARNAMSPDDTRSAYPEIFSARPSSMFHGAASVVAGRDGQCPSHYPGTLLPSRTSFSIDAKVHLNVLVQRTL